MTETTAAMSNAKLVSDPETWTKEAQVEFNKQVMYICVKLAAVVEDHQAMVDELISFLEEAVEVLTKVAAQEAQEQEEMS